ncbi:hypothetical protein K438DRAFT_1934409 [Mycena galopus ATCC 62051]|nr:hypothetical protein K438DRAFT_1934409 [Mycena galopus ATCC 62051]
MSSPAAAPPFDAATSIGAYQIGVLIAFMLFGIVTTQMYIYFNRFPDDDRRLKILVGACWIFELAHAMCIANVLYTWTILDFTNPAQVFGPVPTALSVSALFAGLVEACAQTFFAYRIFAFSKNYIMPAIIIFLAFAQLVGSITITITGCQTPSLPVFLDTWGWLLTTDWSIAAANDIFVTASLLTILIRQRSNALRKTAKLMDKLILWAVETGMITCAAAIIAVIWFETFGTNFIWLAGHILAPKVISNSLLANLNSRTVLRSMNESVTLNSVTPAVIVNSNNVRVNKVTYTSYDNTGTQQSDKTAMDEQV